jgi:hypothetical protein
VRAGLEEIIDTGLGWADSFSGRLMTYREPDGARSALVIVLH